MWRPQWMDGYYVVINDDDGSLLRTSWSTTYIAFTRADAEWMSASLNYR